VSQAANTPLVGYLNNSLKAQELYKRDRDYIVRDGEVMLIDEFTGRMMHGRRLSEGLHQAIEAKEGAAIQPENQTLASVTIQNYFRLYHKLSGMTGTAATEAQEFLDIYKMDVTEIPTNRPVVRIDDDDEVYRTSAEKHVAIIALIEDCYRRGQPILVGTVSIEKSELLSEFLTKENVAHKVLNARHHESEAPATVLNSLMAITRAGGAIGIPGLYVTEDPGSKDEAAQHGNLRMRFGLGWAKSHRFSTGQTPVLKYNFQLMQAILHDRLPIAKIVNATVISLDDAPDGYKDFDKGAAKKFVLDPHGTVRKAA